MKPDPTRLSPCQNVRHGRYYCGLCHGVGTHVGHGWRGLHSHDAIFIATVVDGLVDSPAGPSSCRCPMLPVVHMDTKDPGSVAIRYAVGVQLLLADQWVEDKAEEGSRAARIARPLLKAPIDRGAALLQELGVDTDALRAVPAEQGETERDFRGAPIVAAGPTERALAGVFATMATLPGADPADAEALTELGHNLGRAIYLVDALEDLEEDAQEDGFNPCLRDRSPDAEQVSSACDDLAEAMQKLDLAVDALPWRQNEDLVRASIDAVRDRADAAMLSARALATPEQKISLAAWLRQPAWMHAAAAFLTALTSFWAAFASTARAGTEQAGVGARRFLPDWIAPRTDQCPCGKKCPCCEVVDDCSKGCNDCSNSCNECQRSCNQCMTGCGDCANSCNSLGALLGSVF